MHRDEEGTVSLSERENRKSERSVVIIERLDADQVEFSSGSDGLFTKANRLLDERGNEIRELIRSLIVLAGLIIVALLLWRAGMILRIGHFIPSP
ncbi:hypothetical protein [Halorussus ruber]|uniref:hypothetical protein n=1 Tax=Halorussus ruber TaxID=1126238 RepID=UPI001091C1CE|nr:hypothetical protein [Halorussus ruber]